MITSSYCLQVDGVVTDDNDVFLFGGDHVYRCRQIGADRLHRVWRAYSLKDLERVQTMLASSTRGTLCRLSNRQLHVVMRCQQFTCNGDICACVSP